MNVEILKSKLGKVKITEIIKSTENSVEIPVELMQLSMLFPNEKVYLKGKIFTVNTGRKESKEIVLKCSYNDFEKGEELYILSFGNIDVDGRFTHNVSTHHPRIIKTNQYNRVVKDEPKIKKLKPIIHKP